MAGVDTVRLTKPHLFVLRPLQEENCDPWYIKSAQYYFHGRAFNSGPRYSSAKPGSGNFFLYSLIPLLHQPSPIKNRNVNRMDSLDSG